MISVRTKAFGHGLATLRPFCSVFYREQSLPEGGDHKFREFWLSSRKWGFRSKELDNDEELKSSILHSVLLSAFALARLSCVLLSWSVGAKVLGLRLVSSLDCPQIGRPATKRPLGHTSLTPGSMMQRLDSKHLEKQQNSTGLYGGSVPGIKTSSSPLSSCTMIICADITRLRTILY